jgi:hypothetical protein
MTVVRRFLQSRSDGEYRNPKRFPQFERQNVNRCRLWLPTEYLNTDHGDHCLHLSFFSLDDDIHSLGYLGTRPDSYSGIIGNIDRPRPDHLEFRAPRDRLWTKMCHYATPFLRGPHVQWSRLGSPRSLVGQESAAAAFRPPSTTSGALNKLPPHFACAWNVVATLASSHVGLAHLTKNPAQKSLF